MDKFADMIPLSEALARVDAALTGRTLPTERIAPADAVGRTLADDAVSRLDLPPFNKSAMDGYAVLDGDERGAYRLLETVAAGSVPQCKLEPGTAVKVMTGACVPEGAGKVIPVEDTRLEGDRVRVTQHTAAGNICARGEDVRAGQVALPAGTVLAPAEVANLVSCGITEVRVARAVRLAVLSTGDEIVRRIDDLAPGKIVDANAPMLCALAGRFAMDVTYEGLLPDEPEATARGLREAAEAADIVVVTGGVSVGDFDYVLDSYERLGLTLHFSRVLAKPGKPTTFATGASGVVFGLPGNPVSAFLMFHLFVLRAARLLSGARAETRRLRLPLGCDFRRRSADRLGFLPCRVDADGRVQPREYHGSAHLLALTGADGFFLVPVGTTRLGPGDAVDVLPVTWGAT